MSKGRRRRLRGLFHLGIGDSSIRVEFRDEIRARSIKTPAKADALAQPDPYRRPLFSSHMQDAHRRKMENKLILRSGSA